MCDPIHIHIILFDILTTSAPSTTTININIYNKKIKK